MATQKVTITIDQELLDHVRRLVKDGEASSLSAYIRDAIRKTIENEAAYRRMLDDMLAETGGPLTDEERAWAEEFLSA